MFEAETETFWLTEFYRDALDEAQALKVTLEAARARGDAAGQEEGRALLPRFRRLQALLRGEAYEPEPDALSRDVEAQKRGELPEFIARRLAAEQAGVSRVVREDRSAAGRAARRAADLARAAEAGRPHGPLGGATPQSRK